MSEHGRGGVIRDSTARRMRQLAEENRKLRRYVGEVMARLQENERLFERLLALEVGVLASPDAASLCRALIRGLRERFDLDMARLWFDREGPLAGPGVQERDVMWLDGADIKAFFPAGRRVRLIRLQDGPHPPFLAQEDAGLGSVAMVRLGTDRRPFGILGMGSLDAERFRPGKATDFLQHLSLFVTLGLENILARQQRSRDILKEPFAEDLRRFFQPDSHQPLAQWFGEGVGVACLYLDIDGLAKINAQEGREAGDRWLEAVAAAVRTSLRRRDLLLRTEMDEMAVLLPFCSLREAEACAARVQAACRGLSPCRSSLSIGVAHAEAEATVRDLIHRACRAMYVAKALGGGRIEHMEEECG